VRSTRTAIHGGTTWPRATTTGMLSLSSYTIGAICCFSIVSSIALVRSTCVCVFGIGTKMPLSNTIT
jgi:hypothetical protein